MFEVNPELQTTPKPIVALESTVIAHGLPYPQNLETARRLEAIVRQAGAVPATIGIIAGHIRVGLTDAELERLATAPNVRKCSRRDLPIAVAQGLDGATTVATTMWIAHQAGIRVFATGGIGGVHRGYPHDVSADLPELARTSVAVVCAGAKAILDLPLTLEWLETFGVPVLGYRTNEFPAFYSPHSGLSVDARVESIAEAAAIVQTKWDMGLEGGVLLTVPVPEKAALPSEAMERAIQDALAAAEAHGIHGADLTPFLLAHISRVTGQASLQANLALLEQNARVAAELAQVLATFE